MYSLKKVHAYRPKSVVKSNISNHLAISPIDGRYRNKIGYLSDVFSEASIIKHRVFVEAKWVEKLSEIKEIKEVNLTEQSKRYLNTLSNFFEDKDIDEIKNIETFTNHDVKSVEYYIKNKFTEHSKELDSIKEFVHFACTSEDINNIVYAIIVRKTIDVYMLPIMYEIIKILDQYAKKYATISMLSRTHGQVASPTTLGKEFSIFAYRLKRQYEQLKNIKVMGKFAGAVGNYNAHIVAYPEVDWENIAKKFVNEFELEWNPYVTQIESHDNLSEILLTFKRFNTILLDLNKDIWTYISMGYFNQKLFDNEVGSSTMPHKINPIDFENSEGNLGISNALMEHLSSKLPISRLQRDLTDSTVMRNLGVCFSHSMISYLSTLSGLEKITVNKSNIERDIDNCWEILAEPIQIIMKKCGYSDAYEILKKYTRGRVITKEIIRDFIKGLNIPNNEKEKLLKLSPKIYTGNASYQANKPL